MAQASGPNPAGRHPEEASRRSVTPNSFADFARQFGSDGRIRVESFLSPESERNSRESSPEQEQISRYVRNLCNIQIKAAITFLESQGRLCFHAVTGAGKTPLMCAIGATAIGSYPVNTLIVPTKILSEQSVREILKFTALHEDEVLLLTGDLTPKKREKIYRALPNNPDTPEERRWLVVTADTLAKDLKKGRVPAEALGTVFVDEGHFTRGESSYRQIAKFLKDRSNRVLLVSASPGKDKKALDRLCDDWQIPEENRYTLNIPLPPKQREKMVVEKENSFEALRALSLQGLCDITSEMLKRIPDENLRATVSRHFLSRSREEAVIPARQELDAIMADIRGRADEEGRSSYTWKKVYSAGIAYVKTLAVHKALTENGQAAALRTLEGYEEDRDKKWYALMFGKERSWSSPPPPLTKLRVELTKHEQQIELAEFHVASIDERVEESWEKQIAEHEGDRISSLSTEQVLARHRLLLLLKMDHPNVSQVLDLLRTDSRVHSGGAIIRVGRRAEGKVYERSITVLREIGRLGELDGDIGERGREIPEASIPTPLHARLIFGTAKADKSEKQRTENALAAFRSPLGKVNVLIATSVMDVGIHSPAALLIRTQPEVEGDRAMQQEGRVGRHRLGAVDARPSKIGRVVTLIYNVPELQSQYYAQKANLKKTLLAPRDHFQLISSDYED